MRRTVAREKLMLLIFQMEAQQDRSEEAIGTFKSFYMEDQDQVEYFDAVLKRYLENSKEIDEIIENGSSGWHLGRMARVDLAVLRLAVTEICFMEGEKESLRAPAGAAINEAVNLAKKFGSEDSGKFVNGVLGKIARSR